MSDTTPTHNEANSLIVSPGWTSQLPDVMTRPDGPISIEEYGVCFEAEPTRRPFYPLRLLEHIFTEQVLSNEINALNGLGDAERGPLVRRVLGLGSRVPETYIKVFAILKVIGQLNKLPNFVDERVSDQELPLISDQKQSSNCLFYGRSRGPLPDHLLEAYARTSFHTEQYNMLVDLFDNKTQPYDLAWAHVLPYYRITKTSSESEQLYGGSGSVSKILIHPLCHKFGGLFGEPGEVIFFALKEYHNQDPDNFRREVEMLQRFKRTEHPHLATLLASYTQDNKHFLIFPWATHDLSLYWEKENPTPDTGNIKLVRWICNQSWKLSEAVSCIHHLDENSEVPEEDRLYGRHGDLKPENILWYRSREGFGNLVITDMGLSKTHRFASRTYNTTRKPSATPRYRPPEVDCKAGTMGRTFDIWTLGCLFLEFLIWLNGGYTELVEFQDNMMTKSIRGVDTDEYFEWVRVQDAEYYAIRVKDKVTERTAALRTECSQFTYDFLDIIENRMLVVERNERISAKELAKEMESLNSNCINGSTYCIERKTRELVEAQETRLQRREFREDLPTKRKGNVPKVLPGDFR
ncbi:hypothetical protein E0Z10_g6566 [Xylaria hypoxylon]|uniref:Protein kinase domain-containing protein n=1 Tax=Xylaria hypoxylon TaxID=37992 RepID=A0A4Z0YXT6_9PEZI|nr:hypothetical protein E0Z10_g6566 [Xylaria hypoxylon]